MNTDWVGAFFDALNYTGELSQRARLGIIPTNSDLMEGARLWVVACEGYLDGVTPDEDAHYSEWVERLAFYQGAYRRLQAKVQNGAVEPS